MLMMLVSDVQESKLPYSLYLSVFVVGRSRGIEGEREGVGGRKRRKKERRKRG
jgi:hypothetical protein